MRDSTKSRLSTLLVVLGALAVVSGGALGAITIDTETTDTSTTSDVTDGSTIAGFEANSSNSTWVEASGLTSDAKLQIIDPDTGATVYVNGTPEATNSSQGYYAFNVTHDELNNLPINAGENESYTFRLTNDTTLDNPETKNITVYVEGVEGRTVVYVSKATIGDDEFATLKTDGFTVPFTGTSVFADEMVTLDQDDVDISGDNTTVTYHVANASATDRLSTSAGDVADGVQVFSTVLKVNGDAVPVFYNTVPDDFDTSKTYAVYEAGEDDVTIHVGDDLDADKSMAVSLTANADTWTVFRTYGFDALSASVPSFGMSLGGGAGLSAGLSLLGLGLLLGGFRIKRE